MFRKLIGSLLAALASVAVSKPQPIRTILKPVYVPVRGGFQFSGRTNGASRRRKTNRLHLSTRTRNKHR